MRKEMSAEKKAAHLERMRLRWANPAYREKMAAVAKAMMIARNADPEYRAKTTAALRAALLRADPAYAERRDNVLREIARRPWSAERRAKNAEMMKQRWADPAYREKTLISMRRAHD